MCGQFVEIIMWYCSERSSMSPKIANLLSQNTYHILFFFSLSFACLNINKCHRIRIDSWLTDAKVHEE